MLSIIKSTLKLIKLYEKSGNKKDEINKLKLEIYSMVLGYYSCMKDKDIFKLNEEANKKVIIEIINNMHKIIYFNVSTKDKLLDSITNSINQLIIEYKNNKQQYEEILKYFKYGYKYYDYYTNKYDSIFDYVILHKPERIKSKAYSAIKRISR